MLCVLIDSKGISSSLRGIGKQSLAYLFRSNTIAVTSIGANHATSSKQSLNRIARLFAFANFVRIDLVQQCPLTVCRGVLLLRMLGDVFGIIPQEHVLFMQDVFRSHLAVLAIGSALVLIPTALLASILMDGGLGDGGQQEV